MTTHNHGPDAPIPPAARGPLAAMLRKIAKKAKNIGTHFGANAERQLVDKDEIADELNAIARMLEGDAT